MFSTRIATGRAGPAVGPRQQAGFDLAWPALRLSPRTVARALGGKPVAL